MPKLAFVFPGQGSQSIGMMSELLESHPQIVHDTFAETANAINIDLLDMVQNGTAEQINLTENTQPLMLTTDICIWRIWQQEGGTSPEIVAGHSLGEYAALVAAGALSLHDASKIVKIRGKSMQQAVPEGIGGTGAIIGMDASALQQLCEQHSQESGQVVTCVNYNSQAQTVIAGHLEAVKAVLQQAKEAGAKRALMLPLSVPVHCSLMAPAKAPLQEALQQASWQLPNIDVIHNVDASKKTTIEAIQTALIEQLINPVLWIDCINTMVETTKHSIDTLVECGPGKVLFGLNRRINSTVKHATIYNKETISQLL